MSVCARVWVKINTHMCAPSLCLSVRLCGWVGKRINMEEEEDIATQTVLFISFVRNVAFNDMFTFSVPNTWCFYSVKKNMVL